MEIIDETNTIPFDLPDVIVTLKEKYPDICCESNEWMYYEGDTYGVAFNLAGNQQIMLHIHILDEPEDAVLEVVKTLCCLTVVRLIQRLLSLFKIWQPHRSA